MVTVVGGEMGANPRRLKEEILSVTRVCVHPVGVVEHRTCGNDALTLCAETSRDRGTGTVSADNEVGLDRTRAVVDSCDHATNRVGLVAGTQQRVDWRVIDDVDAGLSGAVLEVTVKRRTPNAEGPITAGFGRVWRHEHAILVIPGGIERRWSAPQDAVHRAKLVEAGGQAWGETT